MNKSYNKTKVFAKHTVSERFNVYVTPVQPALCNSSDSRCLIFVPISFLLFPIIILERWIAFRGLYWAQTLMSAGCVN